MRLRPFVGPLAALAALSGGTAVYATVQTHSAASEGYAGKSPARGDRPETEPTGNPRIATFRDALPILARPRRPSDRVSRAVSVGPLLDGAPADLRAARRIRRSDATPAWIAPSSNGEAVCLIAPGELNCPPASEIARRGVAVATFWHAEGPIRVTGIASASVESVEVVTAEGATVEVPVVDGSFLYETWRAAREVRWVGPDGPEEQRLPRIPGRE